MELETILTLSLIVYLIGVISFIVIRERKDTKDKIPFKWDEK